MAENEVKTETPQMPDYAGSSPGDDAESILSGLSLGNQIINNSAQQQNFITHQQAMNQLNLVTLAKSIALIGNAATDSSDLNNVQDMLQLLSKQSQSDSLGSLPSQETPVSSAGAEAQTEDSDQLRSELARIREELAALESRIPK
ncbi:hypothetical protein BVY04_04640 [bacterium M21]|nr:hypothetical protein BVY04_04640 [bacterium M21]